MIDRLWWEEMGARKSKEKKKATDFNICHLYFPFDSNIQSFKYSFTKHTFDVHFQTRVYIISPYT